MKTTILKLFIFISLYILTSCGLKVTDNHGFVHDTNVNLNDFLVGKSTKEDILNILGTPSTKSTFDGEKSWFYVSSEFKKFVFLDGENTDQKILIFSFDNNVLEEKKLLSKNDINDIDYEKTVTDSSGKKLSWLKQFFTNLNPNPFGANQ
jgi:outer membrane protein assembly factor BamE (lipoprotein component of BamABCDE complex)